MKYKFIFVIISCTELDPSNQCYHYLNKYQLLKHYQQLYLNLFQDDIKFVYIEYKNEQLEDLVEIGNYIYLKGKEEPMIPNLLNKTLLAINYIYSKYDFDYIIRTNLSTIWNVASLLKLYNEIPRNNFFGGYVMFNSFISGTGIFISNDLINTLLKINIRAHNHLDDVAISTHMKSLGIRMYNLNISNYKMNYQILNETERNINSHQHKNNNLEINKSSFVDDILYFRVKNDTIERDICVTQNILKRVYNIQL